MIILLIESVYNLNIFQIMSCVSVNFSYFQSNIQLLLCENYVLVI